MMYLKALLLCGAAALPLLVSGCLSSPPQDAVAAEIPHVDELRRIQKADAASDLAEAIKNADLRFKGFTGYALDVPGVADYQQRYAQSNGVVVIKGTTDAIVSKEHDRLLKAARKYAEEYNHLLLRHLSDEKSVGPFGSPSNQPPAAAAARVVLGVSQ